jgi:hypothetical protein
MKSSVRGCSERGLRGSAILAVGVVAVSILVAAPVAAQAASRSRAASEGRQAVARTAGTLASSICSKVSPSAVSAIVGYSVPAATASTIHAKPTAANFGISGVTTICTFGAASSVAELKKDVSLTLEVTSRALTPQEVKTQLAKLTTATSKITVATYSGLGVPGLYFTVAGAGITGEGIVGFAGTTYFGASVEEPLSKTKLASLAKLAKTL